MDPMRIGYQNKTLMFSEKIKIIVKIKLCIRSKKSLSRVGMLSEFAPYIH